VEDDSTSGTLFRHLLFPTGDEIRVPTHRYLTASSGQVWGHSFGISE
jgi:hypothetical protein